MQMVGEEPAGREVPEAKQHAFHSSMNLALNMLPSSGRTTSATLRFILLLTVRLLSSDSVEGKDRHSRD